MNVLGRFKITLHIDWNSAVFCLTFYALCTHVCTLRGVFTLHTLFLVVPQFFTIFEEKVFWKILRQVLSELITSVLLSWLAEKLSLFEWIKNIKS